MPTDQDYMQQQEPAQGIQGESGDIQQQQPQTEAEAIETFELALEGKPVKVPTTTELSFVHDGRPMKVPYSKLLNNYRQAQNYEDKFKGLKTEREKFMQEQSQFQNWQDLHKKYGAIQEWSEKNPDEFKAIWELYQNRDKHLMQYKLGQQAPAGQEQQGQVFQPFIDEISSLKQQLRDLSQFKEDFDKHQETVRQREDAEGVKKEIQACQNAYPEIDLKAKDSEGVSEWAKVLNYGIQKQMPDFETAYFSYYKDRLPDIYAARARNQMVKSSQSERRQGIIAKSDKPSTTGQSPAFDPKRLSYDQLANRAQAQYENLVARGQ